MPAPLLHTKLYAPPSRPQSVSRLRLIAKLNDGLQGRLTLVSAPAGFGKTTLVCDWLNGLTRPTAWLSLDDADNDLTRFLTYLIAAFQQVDPELGQTVQPLLQSPQLPSPEVLVPTFINEIGAASTHFTLVLDDYHVISSESVHEILSFFLDNLPPQVHMVITSRADPPLPLSRLRARGQMCELREDDLRFSVEEATTFLNTVMGLAVVEKEVEALEARTEGWITGLQLAGLSMQGRNDIPKFIDGFTGNHRYILDYLTDEVLDKQSTSIKQFLLRTSILDRMCSSLCDAILVGGAESDPHSQETLESLDASNLFIVALDDERHWYRYHHLFGNLLRHHLELELGEKGVIALHQRASQWYSQNGFPDEALDHALAASDYDHVVQLLEPLFWLVMKQGEVNVLARWLSKMPKDLVLGRPQLSIFYAWMLLGSLRLDEIDPYLQNAERLLQDQPAANEEASDVNLHLLGDIDMLNAFLVRVRGDAQSAIALYQRALTRLDPNNEILRGVLLVDLGRAYVLIDDLASAEETLLQAISLNRSNGYLSMFLYGVSVLGEVEVNQGRPHQAMARYQKTVQEIEDSVEVVPPIIADIYASLAQLYREWGDLAEAQKHAEKAIVLGEERNFPDGLFQGFLALGQIQEGHGDFAAAMHSFQEAERIIRRSQTAQWIISFTAYQARSLLRQAQLDGDEQKRQAGLSWAYTSPLGKDWRQHVATAMLPSHPPEFTHLTMVRILMTRGEFDEALDLLDWLFLPAQTAGRIRSVTEILMLQAITLHQKEQPQRAYAALEEALKLSEAAGYFRLFVDEGPQMAELLWGLRSQSAPENQPSLDRLIAACSTYGQPSTSTQNGPATSAGIGPPQQNLIEPLSPRELEVLALIANGLSNREIAETLIISIGTVKRHVTNIHGKLGVRSRTQALVKAKELALLGD